MPTLSRLALFRAAVALAALLPITVRAGGGPENLLLVVNSASRDSLAVANVYASLRRVPPINVLMLPWEGSTESVTISEFRERLLTPILRAIDARGLTPQIDGIVYSTDFPWRIDFIEELPAPLIGREKFPSGSLTGMTMLYAATVQPPGPGMAPWLDPESNRYARPVPPDGTPAATRGFRGWYGWGPRGELLEAGGARYLLSVMLGVTAGRGNSVAEITSGLRAAARADGARPEGTIYFMTNSDVRTTTRSSSFPGAVKAIEAAGVKAAIVAGSLPLNKPDVAGLMAGIADFDWPRSGSRILPGAICENLTSYGGIFTPSAGQTPLSVFIRAGAAGSSGTVIEPFAIQAKFPHAMIQVHYVRGASLAEAFYQAVTSPYQLLVVGDPLCQPWARIPSVEVVLAPDATPIAPQALVSGTLALEPRASLPGDGLADRFELFVDGLRIDSCGLGERLSLDTSVLADGHHELRVVAIDASPIETQGRWVQQVSFSNHGRSLSLEAEPSRVSRTGSVRLSVNGPGLDGVTLFTMGRVIGRTSGGEATIDVPAELLGSGPVTIHATGRAGQGRANAVNAPPVMVTVE
jgi:hypothetical protein